MSDDTIRQEILEQRRILDNYKKDLIDIVIRAEKELNTLKDEVQVGHYQTRANLNFLEDLHQALGKCVALDRTITQLNMLLEDT